MNRLIAALIFTSALSWNRVSHADHWLRSVITDLTLTQNSYSDSWKGGEAGNVTWVWNANAVFEKQVTTKLRFKNTLKFSFGQTHTQDKNTKDWAKPQKSTDLIDIENLGLFTIQSFVVPYAALRLETQFLDASIPRINRYFSPAKVTESAGVARVFYKTEQNEFLSRIGFALRQIMTKEISDTLLKQIRTTTTNDGGLESVTDLKLTFSKTLTFTSKLSLFKALFFSKTDDFKKTPQEDYWKAIDANWENRLSATVVKYISVSLYSQLLYDKEIDLRGRFKQTLAMGVTFKLL